MLSLQLRMYSILRFRLFNINTQRTMICRYQSYMISVTHIRYVRSPLVYTCRNPHCRTLFRGLKTKLGLTVNLLEKCRMTAAQQTHSALYRSFLKLSASAKLQSLISLMKLCDFQFDFTLIITGIKVGTLYNYKRESVHQRLSGQTI